MVIKIDIGAVLFSLKVIYLTFTEGNEVYNKLNESGADISYKWHKYIYNEA